MRYELWHSESGGCHTFFPSNQRPDDLEPDAKSIWTVEAATWEDARAAKHEFRAWHRDQKEAKEAE